MPIQRSSKHRSGDQARGSRLSRAASFHTQASRMGRRRGPQLLAAGYVQGNHASTGFGLGWIPIRNREIRRLVVTGAAPDDSSLGAALADFGLPEHLTLLIWIEAV